MTKRVKYDMVKLMAILMCGLFCAICALAFVSRAIPAHVDTMRGRIAMLAAQLASILVGAAIGGLVGWRIGKVLGPEGRRPTISHLRP